MDGHETRRIGRAVREAMGAAELLERKRLRDLGANAPPVGAAPDYDRDCGEAVAAAVERAGFLIVRAA